MRKGVKWHNSITLATSTNIRWEAVRGKRNSRMTREFFNGSAEAMILNSWTTVQCGSLKTHFVAVPVEVAVFDCEVLKQAFITVLRDHRVTSIQQKRRKIDRVMCAINKPQVYWVLAHVVSANDGNRFGLSSIIRVVDDSHGLEWVLSIRQIRRRSKHVTSHKQTSKSNTFHRHFFLRRSIAAVNGYRRVLFWVARRYLGMSDKEVCQTRCFALH